MGSPLEEIELISGKLSSAMENILEEQANCPHKDVKRWGPSYIGSSDGIYMKYDGAICNGCGAYIDLLNEPFLPR